MALKKLEEVASILGKSRSFVYNETNMGRLQSVKVGYNRKVTTASLNKYIEAYCPEVREQEDDSDKLLLTVEQAGKKLSLGKTKMFELIGTGQIQTVKIGRATRIPVDSLNDFIRSL